MRLSSALLAKSAPHPRTHSRRICTSNTPKWLAGPRRRPQDVAGICRESLPWLLTPCSDMKLRMPSMKCMELEEPCMSFFKDMQNYFYTLHVVFQKTCKTILFLACLVKRHACMSLSGSHLRAKINKPYLALSTSVQLSQILRDKL